MTIRKAHGPAALLLLSIALAGCEDGRLRAPNVDVRVVHAAPSIGQLQLLREQRSETALDYKQTSAALVFEADQYDFNVDISDPARANLVRNATFSETLTEGNDYLFVLGEVAGLVTPIVIEKPVFESTTDSEITAVHAGVGLGALDVYLEPPGTDLASAVPLGTLEFGETLAPVTRPGGSYQLSLAPAGAPASPLMTSQTLTFEAGDTQAFVVIDGSADTIAPAAVVALGAVDGTLVDTALGARLLAINAAADTAARDLYVGDDFTAPVIAAAPYLMPTASVDIPASENDVSVTPAGNPGVIEADAALTPVRAFSYVALIAGEPGALDVAITATQERRIGNAARLRVMNGSSQITPLDFYLIEPGADVDDYQPLGTLAAPGLSPRISIPPGDYELVLIDPDTDAIVAGPQLLSLSAGGLYAVLAVNGATSGTADLVLLEDFN